MVYCFVFFLVWFGLDRGASDLWPVTGASSPQYCVCMYACVCVCMLVCMYVRVCVSYLAPYFTTIDSQFIASTTTHRGLPQKEKKKEKKKSIIYNPTFQIYTFFSFFSFFSLLLSSKLLFFF